VRTLSKRDSSTGKKAEWKPLLSDFHAQDIGTNTSAHLFTDPPTSRTRKREKWCLGLGQKRPMRDLSPGSPGFSTPQCCQGLIEAGGAKELVSYVLYIPQIFTAEVNCPWQGRVQLTQRNIIISTVLSALPRYPT
jgi:hypothetical protein